MTTEPLDQKQLEAAELAVTRARIALTIRVPFLATALLSLPLTVAPSGIETAGTDGYRILVSARFALSLKSDELRGLLAHELMHAVLQHPARRKNRDPELWNIACDFVVNGMLTDFGFVLPEGGLMPPEGFGKANAETLYDWLKKHAKRVTIRIPMEIGAGKGNGQTNSDSDSDSDNQINTETWELPPQAKRRAKKSNKTDPAGTAPDRGARDPLDVLEPGSTPASIFRQPDDPDAPTVREIASKLKHDLFHKAKQAGVMPGAAQEEITASDKAEVNWKALMQRFLSETLKTDWRLLPPSKRFISQGIYLPSCGAPGLGRIVFAIDTSASMEAPEIARILAEIEAFRESFPCRLTVLEADTQIASTTEFEAWDSPDPKQAWRIKGRGGTDFRPVFKWARKEAERGDPPAVIVYATDGYGPFPEESGCPVIWLVSPSGAGDGDFPDWGKIVRMSPTRNN